MYVEKEYGALLGEDSEFPKPESGNWIKKNSKYLLGGTILVLLACIGYSSLEKPPLHAYAPVRYVRYEGLRDAAPANDNFEFNNSYIQNVKSGDCVTIDKDVLLNPLTARKCNCGPYQYWRMDGEEHVINELAAHPYMDELFGYQTNGATVGIYDKTGSNWQYWNLKKDNEGNYVFVGKNSGKCLQQTKDEKMDQWVCNDNDPTQTWKLIEDPCGKMPELPKGKFQLRNLEGNCASVLGKSNDDWAKIVTEKCSADNDHQYWTLKNKNIVSEGASKLCMANWDALGHPGVTQCVCADDPIHNYRLQPMGDNTFNLVSQVDGRCATLGGASESAPLQFAPCDQNNASQKFIFYDSAHPEAPPPPPQPNVIPTKLTGYFKDGGMNWLTITRYNLLKGGSWDSVNQIWRTADGKEIRPGSEEWTTYFGDLKPSELTEILEASGSSNWNDAFEWITPSFFEEWTGWEKEEPKSAGGGGSSSSWSSSSSTGGGGENIVITIPADIPAASRHLFASGHANWLTPDRIRLLEGGEWTGSEFITRDKVHIVPGTEAWNQYFGPNTVAEVNTLFGGPGSWDKSFGWLNNAVKDVPAGMFKDSFPWESYVDEPLDTNVEFNDNWF